MTCFGLTSAKRYLSAAKPLEYAVSQSPRIAYIYAKNRQQVIHNPNSDSLLCNSL